MIKVKLEAWVEELKEELEAERIATQAFRLRCSTAIDDSDRLNEEVEMLKSSNSNLEQILESLHLMIDGAGANFISDGEHTHRAHFGVDRAHIITRLTEYLRKPV